MSNILEPLFILLLLISALSVLLLIILSIALFFIKDKNKQQQIKKLLKVTLLVCIITFCIGFGLCTYSFSQITSCN